MTAENDEKELIDGCFYVKEKKYGTWDSYDNDGNALVTSSTKEHCINATRFYLKGKQEGWDDVKSYDSIVGGKL